MGFGEPLQGMQSERADRVAVVLAGGEGRRLQPYTTVLPKPLMPIGDKAILEVVLRQLAAAGFKDIVLAVGYLAELIRAFVGDGEKFGVRVRYSLEKAKLGTAGPLALIDGLPDNFLVMNGDVLCDLDYDAFFESHLRSGAALTIAAYEKIQTMDYGVLEVDEGDKVVAYVEKPTRASLISTGIYAVRRDVLSLIPKGKPFDFPELALALLESDKPVRAFPLVGIWLDIGKKADYEDAQEIFSSDPSRFLPE